MVSVNIRMSMGSWVRLMTCEAVSTLLTLCTSSSNHLGTFRAGWLASVVGPLPTAVLGGCIGLAVSVWGWFTFKEIRDSIVWTILKRCEAHDANFRSMKRSLGPVM